MSTWAGPQCFLMHWGLFFFLHPWTKVTQYVPCFLQSFSVCLPSQHFCAIVVSTAYGIVVVRLKFKILQCACDTTSRFRVSSGELLPWLWSAVNLPRMSLQKSSWCLHALFLTGPWCEAPCLSLSKVIQQSWESRPSASFHIPHTTLHCATLSYHLPISHYTTSYHTHHTTTAPYHSTSLHNHTLPHHTTIPPYHTTPHYTSHHTTRHHHTIPHSITLYHSVPHHTTLPSHHSKPGSFMTLTAKCCLLWVLW